MVPLVDLHSLSIDRLDRLGPRASEEFDPRPRARGGPDVEGKPTPADRTHLSPRGGAVFGRLVADELKKVEPALAPLLR
jgi:lysophospholipase L1-like esterase